MSADYPPSFTVDSADVLRLILGYLTSLGLHQSAHTLRRESGVGFKPSSLVSPALPAQVRQGEWGSVLKVLQLSQEGGLGPLVSEQVVRELAEKDASLPLAYDLLAVSREGLDQLDESDDEDRDADVAGKISKARSLEQKLAAISASSKHAEGRPERLTLLYGRNGDKQVRRNRLAEAVEASMTDPVPLNRLPTLIQQATKWQSFTGQLPFTKMTADDDDVDHNDDTTKRRKRKKRRKHLDLVSGRAKGDEGAVVGEASARDEHPPDAAVETITEPFQKVKFGKAAVCEAALFLNAGLITASSDGLIEVWDSSYRDLNTTDYPFQQDSVMGHDKAVLCLALSNDQTILASGDATGRVKIWNLAAGKCLRQYQAHDASVTCLGLSRDASRLLTASADGTCREFGLVSTNVLQEYHGHTSYVHSCRYFLEWDNGGDATPLVATSSADGTARVWAKGRCLRIFQPTLASQPGESVVVDATGLLAESPAIAAVLPVPDRQTGTNRLLLVSRSSVAVLVDARGRVRTTYRADVPETTFCAAAVSHNGDWLYLCTTEKDCLVFHAESGRCDRSVRDFCVDSTTKTSAGAMGGGSTSTLAGAEISQILHHPFKNIVAAFSNNKTQKKGVLVLWHGHPA